MAKAVDLNSDLGEGFGPYVAGDDGEIMKLVSSVNVACGWHAGDPLIMERTVLRAGELGLGLGAHPGYPDLLGFGRRRLAVTPSEARAYLLYQVGALAAFAAAAGARLDHVKLHGAFYNDAAADPGLAAAVADALYDFDRRLMVLALSGSALVAACRERGLRVAEEVFADRAYRADGSLVPRGEAGALLRGAEPVAARAAAMVLEGGVRAVDGSWVPLSADSICVHGDNAEALDELRAIRKALGARGISVLPLRELLP